MHVSVVDPARIEREWPDFAPLLEPAVAHDPGGMTIEALKQALLDGRFSLLQGQGEEAGCLLAFHLFHDPDGLSCFASYFAGQVRGGPRQMVSTMRRLMSAFEVSVREAGVTRVYIGGRDWGRVFPDYEQVDDVPNRRRKVLDGRQ